MYNYKERLIKQMKNSESMDLMEVKNNVFTKFINWLKNLSEKFTYWKTNVVAVDNNN